MSQHSDGLHPNEEKDEDDGEGSTKSRRKRGCCLTTWLKLDEWILRDLLIHNYKPDSRKSQRMFFEMYDNNTEDLADIIKEVAKDDKNDNASNQSGAIREKVMALKQRRGTLTKVPNIATLEAINTPDDNFQKSP